MPCHAPCSREVPFPRPRHTSILALQNGLFCWIGRSGLWHLVEVYAESRCIVQSLSKRCPCLYNVIQTTSSMNASNPEHPIGFNHSMSNPVNKPHARQTESAESLVPGTGPARVAVCEHATLGFDRTKTVLRYRDTRELSISQFDTAVGV